MKKAFVAILVGFIVSLYFFPIIFSFFPIINTKNLLAGIGLVWLFFDIGLSRNLRVSRSILVLLLMASAVSLVGLFSVVYNNTGDYAYATYVMSASIWLCGAYAICRIIRVVHGKVDIGLLTNYLMGVCVFQCVMALLIEDIPTVRSFVDSYVIQGQAMLQDMGRLYGIGASLDTAGVRFSLCQIMIFASLKEIAASKNKARLWIYIFCLLIIMAVGTMIARTTLVGFICGLVLMCSSSAKKGILNIRNSTLRIASITFFLLLVLIPVSVFLYNNNEMFHRLFRFAFEAFFNYFETGDFSTDSTDKLQTMWVWPDNLKTWIIGDGYFSNPNGNINYIGRTTTEGYYMGTDVGYLRFIFYFGTIGLIAFSIFLIHDQKVSSQLLPKYRKMFIFILIAGFVIWLKVSTDVFFAFALFLCIGYMNQGRGISASSSPHTLS